MSKEALHSFGNLALITVSGNSKFSNLPPEAKISYEDIIKQSLKLRIMKDIIEKNNNKWTPELAEQHGKEMIEILEKDISSD
ncbi:MAG: HNH endonuclease family protein [Treponemataceae bacterium]|nr:HNH endonuclease family protein [Treponemataceae bacterium]